MRFNWPVLRCPRLAGFEVSPEGQDHPAVRCLDLGVAVHHAGLPKAFLREIEGLLRARILPVIISSPTLGQGLNLSASSLLMYSIRRGQQVISGEEFGNVIGRAGRAHVDIDGQILYVCFEPSQWRLQQWESLKAAARERSIQSGLFELISLILARLQAELGLDPDALLEYVTNNSDIWDTAFSSGDPGVEGAPPPAEVLGSLDTAILALVERLDADIHELPQLLDDILQDSLWTRTLARRPDEERAVQRRILQERAEFIWTNSTPAQRRGYFAAGVSFGTGRLLEEQSDNLNALLFEAEQGIEQVDRASVIDAVLKFAEIVFQIPPFAPREELPSGWREVIQGWIEGRPMAEIVASDPEELVELVEDAIVCRLVWAVEAIRVRSEAHQDDYADIWTGRLAEVLEAGTMDRCAVILIHAGLGSRVAALAALDSFPGGFTDYQEMKEWLNSQPLVEASQTADWPTAATAELWRSFVNSVSSESTRAWTIQRKKYSVNWREGVTLGADSLVRLVRRGVTTTEVRSPDFELVGVLKYNLPVLEGIFFGKIAADSEVEVVYHGPNKLQ